MRMWNDEIICAAQEFAARWGFLTQDLFFQFFCPMSQAQQYRYWSHLIEEGYFYKSNASPRVLLLTHKSRVKFGGFARSARLPIYVEHDAVVARVFLALDRRGLLASSWLEDELMRNPMEAYVVLGAEQVHRVPDLVFDLKTFDGSHLRCALEIEKTTKSQSRYAKIALAYLGYAKISVILFGCSHSTTERAVSMAFKGNESAESKRVPGIFQYNAFKPSSLEGTIRFQDKEFKIEKFLEILIKAPVPKLSSLRESNENAFSLKDAKKEEAA